MYLPKTDVYNSLKALQRRVSNLEKYHQAPIN